jgi:hypothetical protein
MLADTLFCHEQDISRQKALKKAYYTQVLLTPDKLDPEIICKLPANLMLINSLKASIILINGHVFFNLINLIFTINKQLSFLKDKRAKVIRGD